MADDTHRPVIYVIACGGRPAGDLPAFVTTLQADGWEVCVIATPSALKVMDTARLAELTGHVVRYDYKQPDEPDVLPPPDAMVVAPCTFNTLNKWAYGASDTLALGLLNEAHWPRHPGHCGAEPEHRPGQAPGVPGECDTPSFLGHNDPV